MLEGPGASTSPGLLPRSPSGTSREVSANRCGGGARSGDGPRSLVAVDALGPALWGQAVRSSPLPDGFFCSYPLLADLVSYSATVPAPPLPPILLMYIAALLIAAACAAPDDEIIVGSVCSQQPDPMSYQEEKIDTAIQILLNCFPEWAPFLQERLGDPNDPLCIVDLPFDGKRAGTHDKNTIALETGLESELGEVTSAAAVTATLLHELEHVQGAHSVSPPEEYDPSTDYNIVDSPGGAFPVYLSSYDDTRDALLRHTVIHSRAAGYLCQMSNCAYFTTLYNPEKMSCKVIVNATINCQDSARRGNGILAGHPDYVGPYESPCWTIVQAINSGCNCEE